MEYHSASNLGQKGSTEDGRNGHNFPSETFIAGNQPMQGTPTMAVRHGVWDPHLVRVYKAKTPGFSPCSSLTLEQFPSPAKLPFISLNLTHMSPLGRVLLPNVLTTFIRHTGCITVYLLTGLLFHPN